MTYWDQDVRSELVRRCGGGYRERQRMLQSGRLACSKPVNIEKTDDGSAPVPWEMGPFLVDLCKYYCGMLPKGRHASV